MGDQLAGYVKYFVGDDYVAGLEMKLDPQYLSLNPSSALQDTVLTAYVAKQRKTVYVGFRSLLHDTNIHDFLLRFGYRRVYCDLKLVYRPSIRGFVNLLHSLRKVADYIPASTCGDRIHSFLRQESIRRSFDHIGTLNEKATEKALDFTRPSMTDCVEERKSVCGPREFRP